MCICCTLVKSVLNTSADSDAATERKGPRGEGGAAHVDRAVPHLAAADAAETGAGARVGPIPARLQYAFNVVSLNRSLHEYSTCIVLAQRFSLLVRVLLLSCAVLTTEGIPAPFVAYVKSGTCRVFRMVAARTKLENGREVRSAHYTPKSTRTYPYMQFLFVRVLD